MGLTRKMMSLGTLGAVDFRSDKERTAAYARSTRRNARATKKASREQVDILREQAAQQAAFYEWQRQQMQAPQQPQYVAPVVQYPQAQIAPQEPTQPVRWMRDDRYPGWVYLMDTQQWVQESTWQPSR